MSQDTPDLATMAASLSAVEVSNREIPAAAPKGNDAVAPDTMAHAADAHALDASVIEAPTPADTADMDALDAPDNSGAAEAEPTQDEATRPEGDDQALTGTNLDDGTAAMDRDQADDDGKTLPAAISEAGKSASETATDVDSDIFKGFPAAPRQQGEFQLSLRDLVIGKASDGGVYDFDAGAAESLRHAVKVPENIAPIVVTKTGDIWHVTDGWARVEAFRTQFGNTDNVMVRVIEWDGTRDDALYNRFAATFLTLKSRKIDKSILLRQFHLAWNVPQLVLGARIGWTESRVTRELAAAEAMLEAPRFAELHVKAGDPPIDYLYKVQQARSDAAVDDKAHPKRAPEKGAVAKLDAKLETLLAKPERFATAEALAKLGIGKPDKTPATGPKGEPNDVAGAVPAVVPAPEGID